MSAIQNLELNLQLKLELISELLCFDSLKFTNIFKAKAKLHMGKKHLVKMCPNMRPRQKKTCLTCGNISFFHDGKKWFLLGFVTVGQLIKLLVEYNELGYP
jgi:hypothetical protein